MAARAGANGSREMTVHPPEFEYFVRLLQALDPWLNQVVIIGGWAYRLYRLHSLSQRLGFSPLTTFDADIAVPKKLLAVDQDLGERLKASGFKAEFLGHFRPPVTHYSLGENARGFYAEFLTPLTGGVENRGKSTATIGVAGVISQRLRYIELLLNAPWRIRLDGTSGFPVKRPTTVQVPNPASYLAQKLLIHDRLESKDRAKHVVYIHDTIQTFGRSLDRLQHEWTDNVKPMLPKKAAAKVANSGEVLFAAVTDTIRNASIVACATGRNVSPDELRAVCYVGLKRIFI